MKIKETLPSLEVKFNHKSYGLSVSAETVLAKILTEEEDSQTLSSIYSENFLRNYLNNKTISLYEKDLTLKELYNNGDLNFHLALGEYIYQLGQKKHPAYYKKTKRFTPNTRGQSNANLSNQTSTQTSTQTPTQTKDILTREIEIRDSLSKTPNETVLEKLQNGLSGLSVEELDNLFFEIEKELGLVEDSVETTTQPISPIPTPTFTPTPMEKVGKAHELLPSMEELEQMGGEEQLTDEIVLNMLKMIIDKLYPIAEEMVEIIKRYERKDLMYDSRYLKEIMSKGDAIAWATLHFLHICLMEDTYRTMYHRSGTTDFIGRNNLLLLDVDRAFTSNATQYIRSTQEYNHIKVYKLLPQNYVWYAPYSYFYWGIADDDDLVFDTYLSYLYFIEDNITEESRTRSELTGGGYKGTTYKALELGYTYPLLLPETTWQREYTDLLLALQDEFLVKDFGGYWGCYHGRYDYGKFIFRVDNEFFRLKCFNLDTVQIFILLKYLLKDENADLDNMNFVGTVLLACKKAKQYIPGIENLITVEKIDDTLERFSEWYNGSSSSMTKGTRYYPALKLLLTFWVLLKMGESNGLNLDLSNNMSNNFFLNDKGFPYYRTSRYDFIEHLRDSLLIIRTFLQNN